MNAPSARANVLVLGTSSIDEAEFTVRGLKLVRVGLGDFVSDVYSHARGVLIADDSASGGVAAAFFRRHFAEACDAGLITVVDAVGNAAAHATQLRDQALAPFKLTESERAALRFLVQGTPSSLAQTLFAHEPGPEIGAPRVTLFPRKKSLTAEVTRLLQRAFWDCDVLTLEELAGGKTAMQTFRAHATLKGIGAPQPMPFFVKIGDRRTIEAERRLYREWADPFIPFYLRPNLCESRAVCTLGTSALVYNFVDGATTLRQALRSDQGSGTIFSLFEVTLRGLRNQAVRSTPVLGAIQTFIHDRVRADEIKLNHPERIAQARDVRYSTRDPAVVENALFTLAADLRAKTGVYHGDLHAGNVMVRRHDAIVIDFGSMEGFGPLSADPAFLEVSLAFGTDNADTSDSFDEWREFIDDLFLDISPSEPPLPSMNQYNYTWLRKALRELRHVVKCCGVPEREMKIVLSSCLLRFARLDRSELTDQALVALSERRRSYALVIADRLCERLEANHV
jgi:aminoglycoside phosphotransferase (APT) family kinase protein